MGGGAKTGEGAKVEPTWLIEAITDPQHRRRREMRMKNPPSDEPVAIDLSRIALRLHHENDCLGLVQAIERARRVASCVVDLEHARDAFEVLDRFDMDSLPEASQRTIRQSLLFSAVSWYIRATWTAAKNGERGSFAPKFEPRLAGMHERVRDLRNSALAHVNLDHVGDDATWHSACVALVTDGTRQGIFSIAASANYDTGIVELLRELIPAAHDQMLALEKKARGAATKMLVSVTAGSVDACPVKDGVDMERHFGSEEEGVAYLKSLLR